MAERDDLQKHHHLFSVQAHNRATDILYSAEASSTEIENLIELAHVAHWHWNHRTDKTTQNIAVALWLLSRAYSANGLGAPALDYAEQSLRMLDGSGLLPSFFGYAHEALARAYLLLNDNDNTSLHFKLASAIAETVPSPQAKRYLLDQIERIQMPT